MHADVQNHQQNEKNIGLEVCDQSSVYEILNPSYIFYFTPVLLYSISLSFVHSSKHQSTRFLGMDQIEQLLSNNNNNNNNNFI